MAGTPLNLNWTGSKTEPIAHSDRGTFEIEQAGENLFWAFREERPIGMYDTLLAAMNRCEEVYVKRLEGGASDA